MKTSQKIHLPTRILFFRLETVNDLLGVMGDVGGFPFFFFVWSDDALSGAFEMIRNKTDAG